MLLPQVTAEESLPPCALVATVRHQADANLVDSERERVVNYEISEAGFDRAVEEQATVDQFQVRDACFMFAGVLGSVLECRQLGEDPLPYLLLLPGLLIKGLTHLPFDAVVFFTQVGAGAQESRLRISWRLSPKRASALPSLLFGGAGDLRFHAHSIDSWVSTGLS